MKPGSAHAFTLIELLIVIAIIALLTASLMEFITAPSREKRFAEIENEWESGAAIFFSQLVADAHDATELSTGEHPARLVFAGAGRKGGAAAYYVAEDGILRRAEWSPEEAAAIREWNAADLFPGSAVLMSHVVELRAEQTELDNIRRIRLRAATSLFQRDLEINRTMEVIVGPAWIGGKR